MGTRQRYFQSLFVTVAPTNTLLDMRRRAAQLVGVGNDLTFSPHISLLYGDYPREAKLMLAAQLIRELPATVTMNQLTLCRAYGFPHEWSDVVAFPFGE